METTARQMRALIEASKAMIATLDASEVLQRIIAAVRRLFPPSDWSLLLVDPEQGDLVFELCVGEAADALLGKRVARGEGIAGWVAERQQPALVEDVHHDPRFARRFDAKSQFRTQSILAVPLVFQGQTLGVLELVSPEGAEPYTAEQLERLSPFADLAAVALANARSHARVQELTVQDDCTGLYNARHLHETLEQEVRRHQRYGRPASLIFFDMDHFKQVNDTHGHQIGTRLLQEVGELLRASLREVDVPVRYGGDEFVVLLPETDLAGARVAALRLWQRIREQRFLSGEGLDRHLTCSLGFASLPDQASDAAGLLKAADIAMYEAKQAGRDAVAQAGGGVITTPDQPARAVAAGRGIFRPGGCPHCHRRQSGLD